MDIIYKLIDFAVSDTGQLIITTLVGLIAMKYGKHFKVTPAQVEKVLDKASDYKRLGEPMDTKGLAKDVQREIRKSLFK